MSDSRQFYLVDNGPADRFSASLVRDPETGEVYVGTRRSFRDDLKLSHSEAKIGLSAFLAEAGPAQAALSDLIGTLLLEE